VRFLDLVAVKGKKEPVPTYELIGRAADRPLAEEYAPVLGPYHRAMLLYQARQFEEAAMLFRAAIAAAGNGVDQPSAVYVERCQALAQSPPEPAWDGVYVMQHK
jgi:adenylate cyclase